ncbi:hypothetical protein Adt_39788 [Abeliophyllum distichum]|uniref:Uncharacterized protein n=1 Tax=Abeliophyllum distichum TaxID=126358 RepID=A0ABD1Q749_9LAMI
MQCTYRELRAYEIKGTYQLQTKAHLNATIFSLCRRGCTRVFIFEKPAVVQILYLSPRNALKWNDLQSRWLGGEKTWMIFIGFTLKSCSHGGYNTERAQQFRKKMGHENGLGCLIFLFTFAANVTSAMDRYYSTPKR